MEIFHQSTSDTCGPACIVMALKHFGLEDSMTQALEHAIWTYCKETHQTQSSSKGPISHADLARYWLNRGGQARLYHSDPASLLEDPTWQPRLAKALTVEQEAVEKGLELILKEPTQELLLNEINSGALAVVRVHPGGTTHQQLLYEMNETGCKVACPLEGHISYSPVELMRVMTYPPIGRASLILRK